MNTTSMARCVPTARMIRILIVDDHHLFRAGVRSILEHAVERLEPFLGFLGIDIRFGCHDWWSVRVVFEGRRRRPQGARDTAMPA
mgnify:CR=1 FL=1